MKFLGRLPAVAWLALVWMGLWGDLTLANLIVGVLLGALVLMVFPFPLVTRHISFRPWWAFVFAVRMLWDLVPASLQVARLALRPGRPPRGAVIAIALREKSDVLMTTLAGCVSLVPGSSVVELDRENGTLFIHALGVESMTDVERVRRGVVALEGRIIRAFGPKQDQSEEATT